MTSNLMPEVNLFGGKTWACNNNAATLIKLVYLWAFVEASLGGLLHLLHIPITGIVVGGFAVVVNVLLAKYGNAKAHIFIKALGIVLAVKFLLSPYTPFGAYVAVGFQGLLAAIIFGRFGLNKITILLFALLVMIESALQKPLLAYFIFGKDFLTIFFNVLSGIVGLSIKKIEYGFAIIGVIYVAIHISWAFLLSRWSNHLVNHIEDLGANEASLVAIDEYSLKKTFESKPGIVKRLKFWKVSLIIALVIFIISQNVYFVMRVVLLTFLLTVLLPILIRKHQAFLCRINKGIVNDIVAEIPAMKHKTSLAWKLVEQNKGLKKIHYFLIYTIWLNVFYAPSR